MIEAQHETKTPKTFCVIGVARVRGEKETFTPEQKRNSSSPFTSTFPLQATWEVLTVHSAGLAFI